MNTEQLSLFHIIVNLSLSGFAFATLTILKAQFETRDITSLVQSELSSNVCNASFCIQHFTYFQCFMVLV